MSDPLEVSSGMEEKDFVPVVETVIDGAASSSTPDTPIATSTDDEITEKRKMWQIFSDTDGEVQRKSFPVITEGHQSTKGGQMKVDWQRLAATSTGAKSQQPTVTVTHLEDTQQTAIATNDNAALFGSMNGFANPNALDQLMQTPNGAVLAETQQPPKKPPRRVEILPRAGSGNNVLDKVVFHSDSTYTRFDTVEVSSEDEELFGDSRPQTSEEHHYSRQGKVIRTDSDLEEFTDELLLKRPTKRIWLFKSKCCCLDFYRWPFLKTYIKVIGAALFMLVSYVAIVLLIVFIMR